MKNEQEKLTLLDWLELIGVGIMGVVFGVMFAYALLGGFN